MTSSSTSVTVRKINSSDAQAVFDVLESARTFSKVSVGPKWSFAQLAAECREFGLIAEANQKIVSFVLWRDTGVAWEISFLATDPTFQGQGIMSSLIEHLKSDRPENRAIWLEVHAENHSARALYTKAGFEQTGERPKYYADGGTAILYNYG